MAISDGQLKENIISALKRRLDFNDMKEVDMHVNNGVVTITGTVPSLTTSHNVRDGVGLVIGVVDVINKLVVKNT